MTKEQFLSKTIKNGDCLIWQGAKRGNGYGCLKINGKLQSAHRISWKLHNKEIPEGMFVCHKCDVRDCVNPNHLFIGSAKDNAIDAYKKGKTIPPKGSQFKIGHTPANSKIDKNTVAEIKRRFLNNDYKTLVSLAFEYGVSYNTIRDININRSYINVSATT